MATQGYAWLRMATNGYAWLQTAQLWKAKRQYEVWNSSGQLQTSSGDGRGQRAKPESAQGKDWKSTHSNIHIREGSIGMGKEANKVSLQADSTTTTRKALDFPSSQLRVGLKIHRAKAKPESTDKHSLCSATSHFRCQYQALLKGQRTHSFTKMRRTFSQDCPLAP